MAATKAAGLSFPPQFGRTLEVVAGLREPGRVREHDATLAVAHDEPADVAPLLPEPHQLRRCFEAGIQLQAVHQEHGLAPEHPLKVPLVPGAVAQLARSRPGALGLGCAPTLQRHEVGPERHLQLQLDPVAFGPGR